jgi:hypothetical protein
MSNAQDSLVRELAQKNVSLFSFENEGFKGAAWDSLLKEASQTSQVLIGEDHFFNEIPIFVAHLSNKIKFDNFFCEIDPYSADLIELNLKNKSKKESIEFLTKYRNTFSFYALGSEYNLMEHLVNSKINIIGTEQIMAIGDRLVCANLAKITKDKKAKIIYEKIENQSKTYFEKFLQNPNEPMYMLTPEFEQDLNGLKDLKLSKEELQQIELLKLSRKIYLEQNHQLRIQLMKNQLLSNFNALNTQKNLFRYGAVHTPKGESLLKIYDLGNLVNNIADSRFEKSVHWMIVGKTGKQGSPFESFPAKELDSENGDLSFLKPFFQATEGEKWHCFDLKPIRKEVEQGKIEVKDKMLLRTIMGYDKLIIIPKVTASTFPKK